MNSGTRDITYQLRQGQLIALADETGWSVAADPTNDKAVESLLAIRPDMPTDRMPTVVIRNTDQLGLYVAKLPDVAFDLVEFAENPLVVIYDQGKNLSARLDLMPGIAIRRSLSADVQHLIGGFGRGLLTLPFESLTLPSVAEMAVSARFGQLPTLLRRPRILRLGLGGEIQFIRK